MWKIHLEMYNAELKFWLSQLMEPSRIISLTHYVTDDSEWTLKTGHEYSTICHNNKPRQLF